MSFKRNIDIKELNEMLNNNDFLKHLNQQYVKKGKVLLTFRNDEATMYYKGNQLCIMKKSKESQEVEKYEPTIYSKYLPFSRSKALSNKNVGNYTEKEWQENENTKYMWEDVLPEILDNIDKETLPEKMEVSWLYNFSPLVCPKSKVVLLDIEPQFQGLSAREGTKTLTDRIDVVLYHTEEKRLIFLEVKRLSDDRLRKMKGNQAEIISQLKEYSDVLNDTGYIKNFNEEYTKVIEYYHELNNKFPQSTIENPPLLGLLIVEFGDDELDELQKITKDIESKGYVVCSRGTIKKAGEGTLEKWYNRIK